MTSTYKRAFRIGVLSSAAMAAILLTSCRAATRATQTARASGEWNRTFALNAGGQVEILNPAGSVTVDTGPEPSVEVHAERVVHGNTEQIARDFLAHVDLKSDSRPDSLTLQWAPIDGVIVGVHWEVNYHVRIPSSASLHVRTGNGDVTVTGVGGHVSLTDSNGNIVARLLGKGIDARNNNGRIDVEIARPTDDTIELRAVNGGIALALPPDMNANLSATAVNGSANVTGLTFEPFGAGPGRGDRRLRGRINAGGTPIDLNTVNGEIRVRAHE